ncbi:MAG: hypothetical protein OEU78_10605, partial [Gammaproteobacteria bacterium]|nr:hypothetical protein [Gammaproteobacteria bacterium]
MRSQLLILLCVIAVLPAPADARAGAAGLPVQQPLLQHIARVVVDSPLPMRRDFSWLAITEM